MRFHIRQDSEDELHSHFTIFVNGANAGSLCMRRDEFKRFQRIVQDGCSNLGQVYQYTDAATESAG